MAGRLEHLRQLLDRYQEQIQGMEEAMQLAEPLTIPRIQQNIRFIRSQMRPFEEEYQRLKQERSMNSTNSLNDFSTLGSSQKLDVNSSGNTIIQIQGNPELNFGINHSVSSPQSDRSSMSTNESSKEIKVFGSISQQTKDNSITKDFKISINGRSEINYSDSSDLGFGKRISELIKPKIQESKFILIFVSPYYFNPEKKSLQEEFNEIKRLYRPDHHTLIPVILMNGSGWQDKAISSNLKLGELKCWSREKPLSKLRVSDRADSFDGLVSQILES